MSHNYPTLSQHLDFHVPYSAHNRQCWTNVSVFRKFPYLSSLKIRHCLDIMHIERNVCDNILATILAIEGKTKDGPRAREALKQRKIRTKQHQSNEHKANRTVPDAPFLVKKEDHEDVFNWFRNVKYPLGYAGSLRNKVKLVDKNFYGLKTHDCHVLLQCLLIVVIRGFSPHNVVKP